MTNHGFREFVVITLTVVAYDAKSIAKALRAGFNLVLLLGELNVTFSLLVLLVIALTLDLLL